jgi:hypothetical protein
MVQSLLFGRVMHNSEYLRGYYHVNRICYVAVLVTVML